MTIFNRKQLQKNQIKASKDFDKYCFLHQEVVHRMLDNIAIFKNGSWSKVLDLAIINDNLSKKIIADKIIRTAIFDNYKADLICDDENLPFKDNSFDLIFSNLSLQFINQVPQFLLNIKNILQKNGVFIASFFGEENLKELNYAMQNSENELYNGISPRLPPTIDVKTAAMILQKAGFKNPISSLEKIEITYKDPLFLLKDLKNMALGNILTKKSQRFFTKNLLQRLIENYRKLYQNEVGEIKATFEIIIICAQKY